MALLVWVWTFLHWNHVIDLRGRATCVDCYYKNREGCLLPVCRAAISLRGRARRMIAVYLPGETPRWLTVSECGHICIGHYVPEFVGPLEYRMYPPGNCCVCERSIKRCLVGALLP